MHKARYIVVEGPIGVGKSSFTRILAEDMRAKSIMDDPDANPFLPSFYATPDQFAFQTQLFFLLSRYRQQKQLAKRELLGIVHPPLADVTSPYAQLGVAVVCDYLFAKDLLFARLNLTEEEYELYLQIYRLLDHKLPKPDVVIFLQATPEILMHRIRLRDKDYESGISAEYVTEVSQAYSRFFFEYAEAPLMTVNVTDLDFMKDARNYAMLKEELLGMIKSGKDKHYVTLIDRDN